MTGFEFAQTMRTTEEKTLVLILDALKYAYAKAGRNFDALSTEDKMAEVLRVLGL